MPYVFYFTTAMRQVIHKRKKKKHVIEVRSYLLRRSFVEQGRVQIKIESAKERIENENQI